MKLLTSLPCALVVLAACASPALAPPPGPIDPAELPHLRPEDFPGAAKLLQGIDPLAAGPEWRRGDRTLLALQLDQGEQPRRWLVELQVDDVTITRRTGNTAAPETTSMRLPVTGADDATFTSQLMGVRVSVSDADGKPLGESAVKVPREFLEKGFAHACRSGERTVRLLPANFGRGPNAPPPIVRDGVDIRPHVEAVVTLLTLLEIVRDDPTLAPILWEVVEEPSILSVVWNLGVRVTLHAHFRDAVRAERLPEHLPSREAAWHVPVVLSVNDEAALYANLLVTSSSAPLSLCGGIIGVQARHPHDPELRFSMMLLAARRGGAGEDPEQVLAFPEER